tara:strand:+ start:141 stop:1505 length:1365 start_codon:yes stop_codon:yes gene_type:complete
MSKIEVDAIDKQSGSTLTLGGSGTAVTLACGATQTGFGRTGTVDWNTTPKTATFTAVSGDGFFANTTGSAFNMNLPAGVAGAIVSVADYAGTWQTNNLTVVPNGTDKIGSVNENATLNTQGQSVTFVYVDSTQGWINTMDSTSNVRGATNIAATVSGACNTLVTAPCCANVKIATFTGPGTFCVSSISSTPAENTVGYMVLAGGASGSRFAGVGGGGAGGFREGRNVPIDNFTASPLVANAPTNAITLTVQGYPITVGAGGAVQGCSSSNGNDGSNSIFSTITSAGGGGGARSQGDPFGSSGAGNDGGSGGGNAFSSPSTVGAGNTPPVSPPQGNPGGRSNEASGSSANAGGGGGGAGGAGAKGTSSCGGNGGAGITTSINATPTIRAGGGGGNANSGTSGTGGPGGGTAGTPYTGGAAATSAAANTGAGGGAGGNNSSGAGGSGIVIIRYKFQ